MTDFNIAFNTITKEGMKPFTIEHFFTQRKVEDQQEYISEKTMERKIRKIKRTINYVALALPEMEKNNFNLEVYGDKGYQYKGRINCFEGNIPHLLIPLRGDSQLFVHINIITDPDPDPDINDKESENQKYISFIPVPKRYQLIENKVEINAILNKEGNNIIDVKNSL